MLNSKLGLLPGAIPSTSLARGTFMRSNESRPAARCVLFWDYDTQWGADRSRGGGTPKAWGMAEFDNTERLLELHARFNIPACFAIVGAAALPGGRLETAARRCWPWTCRNRASSRPPAALRRRE